MGVVCGGECCVGRVSGGSVWGRVLFGKDH